MDAEPKAHDGAEPAGVASVGSCARCGAFYGEADRRVIDGRAYCAACGKLPEVDYIEAFRLRYWGKRDGWAWLFGIVSLVHLAAAAGTAMAGSVLFPILFLLTAGVNVAFWLGLGFARPGIVAVPLVLGGAGIAMGGDAPAVRMAVPLLLSLAVYQDTRNQLFFKVAVPRRKLEKAWNTYMNNPIARAGFILSLLGLVIPGFGLLGLVCSLIGLRRVDPAAHPPVGRRRQAIAGIVLGSLSTLVGVAFLVYHLAS